MGYQYQLKKGMLLTYLFFTLCNLFFTLQFLQNEIEGKALFLTKEFNHHHKLEDLAAATSAEVSKIHQVRKIACYP